MAFTLLAKAVEDDIAVVHIEADIGVRIETRAELCCQPNHFLPQSTGWEGFTWAIPATMSSARQLALIGGFNFRSIFYSPR